MRKARLSIDNNTAGVLLFCVFQIFIHLGKQEIQPWDEGLYAIRAKVILLFGQWWDQSKYTVDGLYSSSYPPLIPWLTAISMTLFGETTTAIRLPVALCSGMSLGFFFALCRRVFSRDVALTCVALLAGTELWNRYSRMGMFDVPLACFALGSVWAFVRVVESKFAKQQMVYSALLLLFLLCGLMTKPLVSLLPLGLLFVTVFVQRRTIPIGTQRFVLSAMLASVLISAPWYWWMYAHHGNDFLGYLGFGQALTNWEESPHSGLRGIGYYFNQLFINVPMLVFMVGVLVVAIVAWIRRTNATDSIVKVQSHHHHFSRATITTIMMWWFGTTLIVYSAVITKFPHYLVLLLPPLVFLSVHSLESLLSSDRFRFRFSLALVALLGVVWSQSQVLRDAVQSLLLLDVIVERSNPVLAVSFLIVSIIIVFSPLFLSPRFLTTSAVTLVARVPLIVAVALMVSIAFKNIKAKPYQSTGAADIARTLDETGVKEFVYLYPRTTDRDSTNPQIAWYTNGWTLGWQKEKTVIKIPVDREFNAQSLLSSLHSFGRTLIVYYPSANKDWDKRVRAMLAQQRVLLEEHGNYLLYSDVKFDLIEKDHVTL